MKMKYCIDPDVESPVFLCTSYIGFDYEEKVMGIDGSLFQRELMQVDAMGKKSIQVWINSPGGVVMDCYNMYNAIIRSKTPVDTYNIGMAISSAGVLFMAGRKRIMMDYAILMIHSPSSADGEDNPGLNAMKDSLITMISSRCSLTTDSVRNMMEATTWLNAKECMDGGFCTEVENTEYANQKYMPSKTTSVNDVYKQMQKISNSLFYKQNIEIPNQKNKSMRKVTDILKLADEASEAAIVDSIRELKEKAYNGEREIVRLEEKSKEDVQKVTDKLTADMKLVATERDTARKEIDALKETNKTELEKATNALAAKEKEFNDMKTAKDALQTAKDDAVAAEKKTKAEGLVSEHVKSGRIKNDAKVIAKWTDMAVTDFEGAKEMIENIPLIKGATKIEKIVDGVAGVGELSAEDMKRAGSAEVRMIEIANRHKQRAGVA